MLFQKYLESSKNEKILLVINGIPIEQAKGVAVLFPGFSQSKSDLDYFMTKLSKQLNFAGYIAALVDVYGHGDSYGDLENFEWNDFVRNAEDIHSFLSTEYSNLPKIMITRGIFGNIAMNKGLGDKYFLLCINPVANLEDTKGRFDHLSGKADFNELLKENEEWSFLFEAMGCEVSNICAQKIDANALKSLADYSKIAQEDTFWSDGIVLDNFEKQAKSCFAREPLWQDDLIEQITAKVEKMGLTLEN